MIVLVYAIITRLCQIICADLVNKTHVEYWDIQCLPLCIETEALHLSAIPNICYSAALQLSGGNCLRLPLAGSLCQLIESFSKATYLAVADNFLCSQTSKLSSIRPVIYVTLKHFVVYIEMYWRCKGGKMCYYLNRVYVRNC